MPAGDFLIRVIDDRIKRKIEQLEKQRTRAVAGGGHAVTPTAGGVPVHGHGSSAHTGLATGDEHSQYQKESEKGVADGYAALDSGILVPVAQLGVGAPTGLKFLRDDQTWQVPPGGGAAADAEEDGVNVVTGATAFDFRHGLDVTASGTEARVAVDETELTITHAQTTGQGVNDHHNRDHATRHEPGGADAMAVDAAAATGSLRTLGAGAVQAAPGTHSHGAGGGLTIPLYIPDAPPASPHANDDEFNDSDWTTGGIWTEWDHGAILTPAEGTRGLTLTPTAAGNDKWCGVYRAVPAGDWALVTKVALSSDIPATGDFLEAGIVLLQDGASSTADHYDWGLQNTTAAAFRRGIALTNWSAYNVFNVSTVAMEADGLTLLSHVYLRVRRIAATPTYYYDWSTDGDAWLGAFNHTPAFTVAHVGLGVWKGTDRNVSAMFRFWRQTASTSLYSRLDGQVLSL